MLPSTPKDDITNWAKFAPDEAQFAKFLRPTPWERLKAWFTYKPRHAKRATITLRGD